MSGPAPAAGDVADPTAVLVFARTDPGDGGEDALRSSGPVPDTHGVTTRR